MYIMRSSLVNAHKAQSGVLACERFTNRVRGWGIYAYPLGCHVTPPTTPQHKIPMHACFYAILRL